MSRTAGPGTMPDGAKPEAFPITVKAFLSEAATHLRRGDVILSRSPTVISRLIRKATGSAFSHASLVFLTPQPEDGFNSTFVLESTRDGVGLANLRNYIAGRAPAAEIAVLRLNNPDLDDAFFKKVNGLMLDHVKSGYDYGKALRVALSAIFGVTLGLATLRSGQKRAMQETVAKAQRRFVHWVPPQFICSGFIQYGFLKAALLENMDVEPVIFRNGLTANSGDALLAVTPEDIATSGKFEWLYVARRGYVYQAHDRDTALKFISGAR